MNDAKVVAELEALRLPELQAKFEELVGEPTKSPNKKYLVRKIVDRMAVAGILERHAAQAEPGAKVIADAEAATEATMPQQLPQSSEPAPKKKGRRKADSADGDDAEASDDDGEKKLAQMTVDEMRVAYREIVGRETRSTNARYLRWRLAQARKGRVPVGARARRGSSGPMRVLPVRTPAAAVEPLGEARKRLGLRSRNDLILRALHDYLAQNGEAEVAALLTDDSADDAE